MASKKMYVQVAGTLAAERATTDHSIVLSAEAKKYAHSMLTNLTHSIGDAFAQDNPRFDREIFNAAADQRAYS